MARNVYTQATQAAINARHEMLGKLASQGVTNEKIDAYLASGKLSSILSDNKLLAQYFQTAAKGLGAFTHAKFDGDRTYTLSAEAPSIGSYGYREYFSAERDTSLGEAMQHYIPAKHLLSPQWLLENGYMNEDQARALQHLMEKGIYAPGGSPASPEVSPSQGPAPTDSKQMSSGGYGSSDGNKQLSGPMPPPPPGGGTSPSGYGGGGLPTDIPSSFTEQERAFVSQGIDPALGGWFGMLFGRADMSRGIQLNLLGQMDAIRKRKQQIAQLISNLDPTDPEQMHQMQALTMEKSNIEGDERDLLNKMTQVQRYEHQFIELVTSMFKTYNQTKNNILANTRS